MVVYGQATSMGEYWREYQAAFTLRPVAVHPLFDPFPLRKLYTKFAV
jgi:hypothetical protein